MMPIGDIQLFLRRMVKAMIVNPVKRSITKSKINLILFMRSRGEIPARLCCQPPGESHFLHNVQAGAHILLYADRKGE